jgi:tRNA (guanine-N7-)-methyltransferase
VTAAATAPLWHAVFGRDAPVEIEIGAGRGEVLLAFAAARPERSFFAVEWGWRQVERIRERAARRELSNVRAVSGDARCIVRHLVPAESVAAYHVYFPDPWPKTRHRHRRLFQPGFADALARTLVPGGRVHVASDLPDLFAVMAGALADAGFMPLPTGDDRAARPITRFERKYARAGTHEGSWLRPGRPAQCAASEGPKPQKTS